MGQPHPDVVLIKPNPERRIGWRARFEDPDTGRTTWETLDASLTTAEARDDWAVRKSKALARRRLELEGGALPATGTLLADAIDRYFRDHLHLRPATRKRYRDAADKLIAFVGPKFSADDLTGPRLVAFRAELVKQPRAAVVSGGKRGQRKPAGKPRAPYTINSELLRVGTVLHYVRRLGLLPKLTADALADGLKKLPVQVDTPEFLRPAQIQRLLDAALAHDAETYKATRQEHAGLKPAGSTPRYPAIAPLVAVLLLSGMRFGEALALTWEQIDLDALGDDGQPTGEIALHAASTKTHRGRVVTLDHSPALRELLTALRPKDAAGPVWSFTRDEAVAAGKRLQSVKWTWQVLRSTAGTYLTNAPGIFGGASAYRSARLLGHSVTIAEKHYTGLVRVPREARTLESAMQIKPQVERVIAAVRR